MLKKMLRALVPVQVPYKNLFWFQELSEIIMLCIALIYLVTADSHIKGKKILYRFIVLKV